MGIVGVRRWQDSCRFPSDVPDMLQAEFWREGQLQAVTPKHSTMKRSRGSEQQQNGTTEPAPPEQPGPRRSVQWNEGGGSVKPSHL